MNEKEIKYKMKNLVKISEEKRKLENNYQSKIISSIIGIIIFIFFMIKTENYVLFGILISFLIFNLINSISNLRKLKK